MKGSSRAHIVALASLVASAALLSTACVPRSHKDPREVGGATETFSEPPIFPETGEVPPALLVDGLVYDFTNADVDLDLWVPPTGEARCAAQKIVENHGKRLSDLGYEPGRSGAAINDIALRPEERQSVSDLFRSCVNTVEAIASLFMGGGHMTSEQALCMARGLDSAGMAPVLFDSWMLGAALDPIADDGTLAVSILDHTNVCLPDTSFTWFGMDLPGDEEIVGLESEAPSDSDLPGSAGNVTTTTAP